jgi:hypothetical protein
LKERCPTENTSVLVEIVTIKQRVGVNFTLSLDRIQDKFNMNSTQIHHKFNINSTKLVIASP